MALVDAQLSWLANIGASYFATGKRPARLGNAHPNVTPYQPVRARDKTMIIAVGNERLWAKFCKILGVEATLMVDPRFATNAERNVHRAELIAQLEQILARRTAAEWVEELVAAGIPAGPINFPDETLTDEHVLARRMIVELEHPLIGVVRSIAAPMRFESNGPDVSPLPAAPRRAQRRDPRRGGDVVTARPRLTLPDVLQIGAEARAELRMAQTVLDRRAQIADLAAAVVADAGERQHVHRLVRHQGRDTVRQLDLAAGTALRALELREDGRRQDVAADDGEIRRRVGRLRLLDDARDALRAARLLLHGHDAVAAGLIARHRFDAEHARAVLLEVHAASA